MAKKLIFILGGARSGKSQFAQELATKLGKKVLFVATGEALDDEMKARIDQHRNQRPTDWRTIEVPLNLGPQIEKKIGDASIVLIDCITLLVSNLLGKEFDHSKAESKITDEIKALIVCINRLDATFIIVSNEVGLGIVPENKSARFYRDLLGKANQMLAQHADEVYFMIAHIAIKIKK